MGFAQQTCKLILEVYYLFKESKRKVVTNSGLICKGRQDIVCSDAKGGDSSRFAGPLSRVSCFFTNGRVRK